MATQLKLLATLKSGRDPKVEKHWVRRQFHDVSDVNISTFGRIAFGRDRLKGNVSP